MIKKDDILDYLLSIKPYFSKKGIEYLGLFGSFVKNKNVIGSDIDIAIRIEKDFLSHHDSWDYFEVIEELKNMIYKKFGLKCDVFDLDSNSFIKKEVEKEVEFV